nr:MAG TPA: hypothetical protein [Caudoviricetes sp.]
MDELETVSVDLTENTLEVNDYSNIEVDTIEIAEIIDLEIEEVEEISIKEFQNNAVEMLVYWSSTSW